MADIGRSWQCCCTARVQRGTRPSSPTWAWRVSRTFYLGYHILTHSASQVCDTGVEAMGGSEWKRGRNGYRSHIHDGEFATKPNRDIPLASQSPQAISEEQHMLLTAADPTLDDPDTLARECSRRRRNSMPKDQPVSEDRAEQRIQDFLTSLFFSNEESPTVRKAVSEGPSGYLCAGDI